MKKISDPREAAADEDYARNRMRGIRHAIAQFESTADAQYPDYPWELLRRIKDDCDKVLSRPRSNGSVIDGLEKTIGDLQSRLIDIDIYKLERDAALKRARAVEAELENFREGARTLERLGRRLDRFIASLRK